MSRINCYYYCCYPIQKCLGLLLLSLLILTDVVDAYTVRVCQNKSCCKRNPNLLQTVHDLVGTSGSVESSGCLSHCDQGPNMEIDSANGIKVLNGIDDSTLAAVQLELTLDTPFPKLLVAAAKVMERAAKSKDPAEQERFLTSVIGKLDTSDHGQSTAMAHAYALRSKVHLGQSNWSQAILDAQQATALQDVASPKSLSVAYRSWVDALEGQQSHPTKVIPVLQAWFKAQPQYRTKLKGEITDWVQRAQAKTS